MLEEVRSEPTLLDKSNQRTDDLVRKLGLEKVVYISSLFVDLHLYAMNSTITEHSLYVIQNTIEAHHADPIQTGHY